MSALPARAADPSGDPAALLWEPHFAEPAATMKRVREVLAAPQRHDERTLAWAELTDGFDKLFMSGASQDAGESLTRAGARFMALGDRRGALLVDTGRARLLIYARKTEAARQMLLSLYHEALRTLPPHDVFWVVNALCATYYYTDAIDTAIRYLYEALERLRTVPMSPQLIAVLSNLAAALVTVADYAPARELAQESVDLLGRYENPQLLLFARSNLAEALLGDGDLDEAHATVEAMMSDGDRVRSASQNHSCAIAAEVYALRGRLDEAGRAVAFAAEIHANVPGAFNEVHLRWAEACLAAARDDDERGLAALRTAADVAARHRHLMTTCKAQAALARRLASLGRFEDAYVEQRKLLDSTVQRLSHRASAKYYLLRVEHELRGVRAERDSALRERQASEATNRALAELNAELSRKMREVEELQSQLAAEAVHDPLTQLFNRRYLDTAMPALASTADRRGTPLSLALVDLDHFKRVNDEHGHLAGDKVLRHIGKLFATSLRPSDVVSRWGGEEFCIVFPDTDVAGAATALATLAARLRALEVDWGGVGIGALTFSAAIAAYGVHGRSLAELVGAADRALYSAKGAGRDRVLVAH